METNSLQRIIHLVENKLGLKSDSISLLIWKDHIHERMAACRLGSYEEYERRLHTEKELQALIELIVNLETWFFRERGSFDYLTYFVNQAEGKIPFFRILSVACSSGEEPYSIAMTLLDAGLTSEDFTIDAFDISRHALLKADRGIYNRFSFRGSDFDFRNRYFDVAKEGYAIKQSVKETVSFYAGNILEENDFFSGQLYQVIFCRNLLIYLNPEAQNKILNLLKSYLAPEGILIVGLAEAQIPLRAGFEFVVLPGTAVFTHPSPKKKVKNKQESFSKEIVKHPLLQQKQEHASLSFQPSSDLVHLAVKRDSETGQVNLLEQALQKANEGMFEEARKLSGAYIRQYGPHPDVYYLLGLLHHTQGQEQAAKENFQKAVYLNPSHSEALICLALLYESEGKRDKAELFRKRALKHL